MKFDSLIFDMDGTLWDAVDSYVAVWNATFEAMGYRVSVSRDELLLYMGTVSYTHLTLPTTSRV